MTQPQPSQPYTAPPQVRLSDVSAMIDRLARRLEVESIRNHAALFRSVDALMYVYRALGPQAYLPPFASPFGGWAITPDLARLVCDLFAAHTPAVVVECGSGVSTLLMGHLLRDNDDTRIVSIEHDPVWYAETLSGIHHAGLEGKIDLRFAPLEPVEIDGRQYTWYSREAVADIAAIDFVLVDGPPGHLGPESRYPAGPILAPAANPGCLFLVDDTVRSEELTMVDRWAKEHSMEIYAEYVWGNKGAVIMSMPTVDPL